MEFSITYDSTLSVSFIIHFPTQLTQVLTIRRKNPSTLAFSVMKDSAGSEPASVDFVAPDETTYNYWVDGLNALLRKH